MNDIANLSADDIARELRNRKFKTQIASLTERYKDAYTVARVTAGFGSTVKGAGILIGGLLTVGGFMLASKGDPQRAVIGILVLILGVIAGVLFYVIGILISAQGQILKASLDSAVNTSPFLENEHRTKIMSLS